eukprot:3935575-Rhodomonas_salina.1
MTASVKESTIKFTEKFAALLKTGLPPREAWVVLEKDIRNVLMDQHLEWVADAFAIFAQECQESTGVSVPAQVPAAAGSSSSMASATRAARSLARQMALQSMSPGPSPAVAAAAAASPAPSAAPSAASVTSTTVLKPTMMQDPAFAPVWESALVKSDLGDLKERMEWERELMLSRFSKNWNDATALGITAAQLKRRHQQWLGQSIRSINRQGINALVEMFIVKGDNSSLQDVFRGILTTRRMQEVALGQHFDPEWAEKLERNPFIQAL